MHVVQALRPNCLFPRFRQCRQQQGREDGDDRDDNKQLDQGKCALA
jgi:hypothetical protein